jgi:hypothetical protein
VSKSFTCERDGCQKPATVVIGIKGTSIDTGQPMTRELRLCDRCLEVLEHSPTITLNGVRMQRGPDGRMHAVE